MKQKIGAFFLIFLLLFPLFGCTKPIPQVEPPKQEEQKEPETPKVEPPVRYQNVKADVSGEEYALLRFRGETDSAILFRVYYRTENSIWKYSSFSGTLDKSGFYETDYPILDGTIGLIVEITECRDQAGKKVFAEASIELIKEDKGEFLTPPVSSLSHSMPSTGKVKACVVFADFPDLKFPQNALSKEELKAELFEGGKARPPYESLPAFFSRASYSNLSLEGEVFFYSLSRNAGYYVGRPREELVREILEGLDKSVDFSAFDSDLDGIIDQFSVGLPAETDARLTEFWASATYTWSLTECRADGKKISQFVALNMFPTLKNAAYMKSSLIHEMGHCMGLPDYYKYNGLDDWQGFHGDAGYTCLDDAIADFCGFSKMMFGWLGTNQIQVASEKEESFSLSSLSCRGSLLLLPIAGEGVFGEYFVVEYITCENNNLSLKSYAKTTSGVRIFHVLAETAVMPWETLEFKYNNYSQYYLGDDSFRVIRLVNDGGGFFQTGDVVSFETKGFAAYDREGKETIDSGYRLTIGPLSGSKIEINVQKSPSD